MYVFNFELRSFGGGGLGEPTRVLVPFLEEFLQLPDLHVHLELLVLVELVRVPEFLLDDLQLVLQLFDAEVLFVPSSLIFFNSF